MILTKAREESGCFFSKSSPSACISKSKSMSHFLPFSSEEAEMAQVQAHEIVILRCLFEAFDNALESQ